jgi:uncharacterized membrane protein
MDADLSSPINNPETGIEKIEQSPEKSSAPSPINPANAEQASVKCPHCGTEMPANAAFCPACGWSMMPLPPAERAAAAVAYLTLVPAAVILLLPAFRKNRFVRFHAWQSILLWGTFFILSGAALFISNVAAAMAFLLFGILTSLAMLFLWLVLSFKAWEGERFELPLVGELAWRLP